MNAAARPAHAPTVSRQLAAAGHVRRDQAEDSDGFHVRSMGFGHTRGRTLVGYHVAQPRTVLGAREHAARMNELADTLRALGYGVTEHRAKPGAPLHWNITTTKPLAPYPALRAARKALSAIERGDDTTSDPRAARAAVDAAQARYNATRPATRRTPATLEDTTMDTDPRTRRMLGKIVAVPATGEWARARLAFTTGEHAGMIEIGMADGTTRMVTAADILPIVDPPKSTRAIPVYPDAADGSGHPMGTCENEGCGITTNVITIVVGKATRDRYGKTVPAPTKTICTHCYTTPGRN